MARFFIFLLISVCYFNSYFSQTNKGGFNDVVSSSKNDTLKCRLISELIESETNDSLWPIYNKYLSDLALKNSEKGGDLKNYYLGYYAYSLSNIGYQNMALGKTKVSYEYYNKALEIYKNINDKSGMAYVLINLGYLYRQEGNVVKAIETYHQALRTQLETNNKMGAASCYNNIGFIFDNQSEHLKALEYYDKALKLYSEIPDKDGVAITYGNIAYVYSIIGLPNCHETKQVCLKQGIEKSIQLYNKAIEIKKELNDEAGLASCYNLLGGILDNYGSLLCDGKSNVCLADIKQQANEYYISALKLRVKENNLKGIVQSYNSLAKFALKDNNLILALNYATEGFSKSEELGSPEEISDAALVLKDIYKKQNQYEKALKMHELYLQMRDSVYNEGNKQVAIKKTYEIEYEKKAVADSVKVAEEKKVTTAQLKEERTQRFALYGGIFLVGLFAVFMFNRFKVTKKQNKLIQVQKSELQKQKEIVEEHQKETLDSIHYAKRIQTALIANSDFITQNIPHNFIYFNPKDIVSGDFYWATKHNNKFYLAVCDSTGHGVPGAFMSLLNMGFLSEAIKEKEIEKPNEVFNYVRERLITTISDDGQKDGMDGILICIDTDSSVQTESRIITYAAANNEPVLIRNNEILELPKDRMPVGKGEKSENFSLHSIELNSGDTLYLYTDGYADQFGGPKGKKFKYKQLNELLLSLNYSSLNEQKVTLENTFNDWKGNLEQVDDVLIIGIQI